jgi:hypothetical protein
MRSAPQLPLYLVEGAAMTKEEKDAQFLAFQHAMHKLRELEQQVERNERRIEYLERQRPMTEYVPRTKWES